MATKPKYLSRFTFGNVVKVDFGKEQYRTGTVVAVKFTESSVFYDVNFGSDLVGDIDSLRVNKPDAKV